MSRAILRRMTSGSAICAVVGMGLALPFSAWAQDTAGGMFMQLRLAERFTARDTSSPDPAVDGASTQLVTDVDFVFTSETRTEAVTLGFGAGYRFYDDNTTDSYTGDFTSPNVQLSYQQTAISASFAVSASATQVNLADVSALTLRSAVSDDGLVADFAELEDGGSRTQLALKSRLTLRDDAPFGLIFDLSVDDISYQDLPSGSTLKEQTNGRFSATGRFDISPVLQARAGLNYIVADPEDDALVTRYGANGQVSLARPNGTITLSGNHEDGDGGAQSRLQFGRSFALPQTKTNFAMGLTHAGDDRFFVTGNASLDHDFGPESALGKLTVSANRDVSFNGADNSEQVVTSLALATSYALSPQANLRLSGNLAQSEQVSDGRTVDLAAAALTLGYAFDRNWQGSAGLSADLRDPSDAEATESATLSLGLTRTFDMRR